ncbi:hypothetical protein [Moraxella lacunata]
MPHGLGGGTRNLLTDDCPYQLAKNIGIYRAVNVSDCFNRHCHFRATTG